MTFTDEDLKRLKKSLGTKFVIDENNIDLYERKSLNALIARLDAAEAMAKPLEAFLRFQGEKPRDIYCMAGLERTKYIVAREKIDKWWFATGKIIASSQGS